MSYNTRIYVEKEDQSNIPQSPISTAIATVLLTSFVGFTWVLFVFVPLGCLFFPFLFIPILLLLISSVFLSTPTVRWLAFVNLPIFSHIRRYFKFSYLIEQPLNPTTHYIMAHFPHGVFPLGPLLAATAVEKMFPGIEAYAISSSTVFKTPLYKHVFSWLGCQPATEENFKKLLKKGSCGVVVGGLAEMYMQHDDHEEILLQSRKGFVRVAVETGSPIIPTYHFGNTRILFLGPRSFESISRKLRFSFGTIYGKWFLPLPFSVPLYMVVGKPIEVEKVDPSDTEKFAQEVDRVHKQFIENLKQLYDKHKGEYGWNDVPLVIK